MAVTGNCGQGYDRFAGAYERWWQPVLTAATLKLLDRVAATMDAQPNGTLVDVGTGTAILPVDALRRWPALHAVGIDASAGMLAIGRAVAEGLPGIGPRLDLRVGDAAAIPVDDGMADVVTSSFVLQLVLDRSAVLAEMRRILRPGGTLACVTWRAGDIPFDPEDAFYDVLDDLGIDVPEPGPQPDPFESPRAAADELRSAGYVEVDTGQEWIQRHWRPIEYLDLLEHWIADDIFGPLSPERRTELRDRTLRRFARLPRSAFAWRAPLVTARAVRPR